MFLLDTPMDLFLTCWNFWGYWFLIRALFLTFSSDIVTAKTGIVWSAVRFWYLHAEVCWFNWYQMLERVRPLWVPHSPYIYLMYLWYNMILLTNDEIDNFFKVKYCVATWKINSIWYFLLSSTIDLWSVCNGEVDISLRSRIIACRYMAGK